MMNSQRTVDYRKPKKKHAISVGTRATDMALWILLQIFISISAVFLILVPIMFLIGVPIAPTALHYGDPPGQFFDPQNFSFVVYCLFFINIPLLVWYTFVGRGIGGSVASTAAVAGVVLNIVVIVMTMWKWYPVANTDNGTLWYENWFHDPKFCCVFQTNNTLTGCPSLPSGCTVNGNLVVQSDLKISSGVYMFLTSNILQLITAMGTILIGYKLRDTEKMGGNSVY